MSESIFGNPTDQTDASNQLPADQSTQIANPYADQLAGIKTDDGRQKYATVDEALASVPHAQKHIMELTTKLKELEQKVQESNNIEDVLERIQSKQAATVNPPKQELDETKLAQLLESQLTQREAKLLQKTNHDSVVRSLEKMYGEKAEAAYQAKAAELGIDVETLNTLSARSPKAVLAYFNSSAPSTSSFGSTQVNTTGFRMEQPKTDPMDMFRTSESELVKKWRSAASKIEG